MSELRNQSRRVLEWVEAGEEVMITKRGVAIARLVPEAPQWKTVDWTKSAAFTSDRSKMRMLTAEELKSLREDFQGNY